MSDSERPGKEAIVGGLIDRIVAGESAAFRTLYDMYLRDVRQILFSFLGPHADTDDLVQTVFIELYRSLGAFERRSRFSTWLYRLTMNVAMQHLRRRGRRIDETDAPEGFEAPDDAPTPSEVAERDELVRLCRRILDGIAPKKRQVFVLHEVEGKSPQEIADIIGTSVHTAKSRLHHARLEFQERWDKAMRRADTSARMLEGEGGGGIRPAGSRPRSG